MDCSPPDPGEGAALAFRLAVFLRAFSIVAVLPMVVALGDPGAGPAGALLAGGAASLAQILLVLLRGSAVLRGWLLPGLELGAAGLVFLLDGVGLPLGLFLLGTCGLSAVAFGVRGLLPAAALAGCAGIIVVGMPAERPERAAAAGLPALFMVVGCAGAAVRWTLDRERTLALHLQQAAGRAAAAEERVRFARDMHDSVINSLHGITMTAEALAGPPGLRAAGQVLAGDLAEQLADAAADASAQARALVRSLREDDVREDLATVVRRVVAEWSARTGIGAAVVAPGPAGSPELPVEPRHQLLKVLREALHNVDKHAGARRVWVGLRAEAGRVLLSVSDDGRGFTMPRSLDELSRQGHYGLIGMFERADAVCATVTVQGVPGRGTTVVFRSAAPASVGTGPPGGAAGRLAARVVG